jgi:uncharacterized protein involved in outer membrane biogenesis
MRMKSLRKLALGLALVLAMVVVGLLFYRNALIKKAAARTVTRMTGFDLEMGRVQAGLFSTTFEIEGLKLLNPPDFPRRDAMEINRVLVDYDLLSLLRGDEIHLKRVVLDIGKVAMVTKAGGETNFQRLQEKAGGGSARPAGRAPAPRPAGRPDDRRVEPEKDLRIDELTIRIGTVALYDYSAGGPEPEVFEHPLGVNLTQRDVTDPSQIMAPILAQVGIGLLMNADYLARQARRKGDDLGGQAQEITRQIDAAFGTKLTKKLGRYLEKTEERETPPPADQ